MSHQCPNCGSDNCACGYKQNKKKKIMTKAPVVSTHPLAEVIAKRLFGINMVPENYRTKMIQRAVKDAVEWYEKQIISSTKVFDDSVIVLKMKDTQFTVMQAGKILEEILEKRGFKNFSIIITPEDFNVECISEKEMEKHGWVRKEEKLKPKPCKKCKEEKIGLLCNGSGRMVCQYCGNTTKGVGKMTDRNIWNLAVTQWNSEQE